MNIRLIPFFALVLMYSCSSGESYSLTTDLQEVRLTPRQDAVCSSYYGDSFYEDSMICAGDYNQDSCSGDSGGPLFYEDDGTLLGIVSWGPFPCADSSLPYGVYTNVFNYIDWIIDNSSLLSPYAVADSSSESSGFSARIIGGSDAATDDHDYFVALMTRYPSYTDYFYPFCGGTYLGDGLVITAAHCVDDLGAFEPLYMVFGNSSEDMAYEVCSYEDEDIDCTTSSKANAMNATGYIVYTGSTDNIYIARGIDVTLHESYDDYNYQNDIALIQLSVMPENSSLALPSTDTFTQLAEEGVQDSVTVIGHGYTQ
ncbi:trypsin-like serine protease [Reinekea marinisedimentorum]|uniref:Trypsin n=1 Tax=Reinekea marinisedimentorum TaxID=230495 RepID=A0A4R3I7B5_9GAMM|nr:trypsin-like serine protease [Reinekea marinisedimentorum]TCS41660.1 trypsin [Reinekea marinisedimentorum]